MKLLLKLSLFFLLLIGDKSFSLSDYQIKRLCKNGKNEVKCIKNLQEKKYNLQKGIKIEIPVVPYKK